MSADARFERLAALPLRSFQPDNRGIGSIWRQVRDIADHRQLLWLLTRRDLQVRYRGSVLGFLWTLIKPLILLATYYVILGQVLGAAKGITNFGIYVFSGLTIYMLFSESLGASAGSIVGNGGLVKKIYVPREIFPLAAVGGAIFMFAMQMVVLIAAIVVFQQWPDPSGLLYLLPSIALILIYVIAIGLLLSAMNVYLRDVQYITEILLTLMMWGSPIVYSWQMVKDVLARFGLPAWLLDVYTNNPLTLAVLGFHRALWSGGTAADYPDDLALRMGVAGGIGLICLLIAHWGFQRMQGNLAQEL
ncbi:ABC transporter permease [Microbacterium rhizomatis]|uniref:Transport permease protein n=1 Tax=Microbacterium rhizomatis TaxID=1631477 RepID=A0A5J5J586_9MICO|nr:ABC transporter permease [Microbacterium rhizomatis]KAA9111241.1 ABC transporter permease [Microbacterium rhizomatis]